jgi:uncharacterized protein (TIGR03083 family)
VAHDRKGAIRDDVQTAQHDLLQVLDRVGPDEWSRPSPNEGWTIRDLLTHLTTSESAFIPALRRMASGQGGVPADFDPNRWNAGQLRRRGEADPSELRAELERSFAEMLSVLEGLDDTALNQRGYLSTGVEGSTEDNFRLVASHKRTHTNDIRAALGMPATT